MPNLSFAEWLLKQEMTSTASTGGGGSFTNDIAHFSRRLFEKPVERTWANNEGNKKKKIKESAYESSPNNVLQQQQQPVQQQPVRSMQGQGFHFKGSGQSQLLYNQGFQAFQKLAQRQPKFANAINAGLNQIKGAFLGHAQQTQGIKGVPNNNAYNDDDFNDALNSLRGSFGSN